MAVSMHWKLLAAAAAFSALAFGACGDDKDEGGGEKQDGGTRADGGGGGIGQIPIADLDDGVAGKTCAEDADCGGTNVTCNVAPNQTQGTCTGFCQNDSQCGAGGKCVAGSVFGQTGGFCGKACTSASECSEGQECREGLDIGGIISGLTDGGGIGVDGSVDMSATCQVKPKTVQLGAGIAGKECTADTACGEGRCMDKFEVTFPLAVTIYSQDFPGGYCTGDCTEDAQCGAGASCFGDAPQLGLTGNCLKTCTAHTDCRADHACTSLAAQGMANSTKYCLPGDRTSPEAGVPDGGASDAGVDAATADAAVDASVDAAAP